MKKKIIIQGTHDEFLPMNGQYGMLWEMQGNYVARGAEEVKETIIRVKEAALSACKRVSDREDEDLTYE